MAEGKLGGKVAIVTGGAQGIGGGTARQLAADGAQVLIVDIDGETGEKNAERIREAGGEALCMVGDVAEESVAAGMVEHAQAEYGRLDILVQNAFSGGPWMRGSAVDIDPAGWRAGARVWRLWWMPSIWAREPPCRQWKNRGRRRDFPLPRSVGSSISPQSTGFCRRRSGWATMSARRQ